MRSEMRIRRSLVERLLGYALPSALRARDGRLEINQVRASETGCFEGEAIVRNANRMTLDLGGFRPTGLVVRSDTGRGIVGGEPNGAFASGVTRP